MSDAKSLMVSGGVGSLPHIIFQSQEALIPVQQILEEARATLKDKTLTHSRHIQALCDANWSFSQQGFEAKVNPTMAAPGAVVSPGLFGWICDAASAVGEAIGEAIVAVGYWFLSDSKRKDLDQEKEANLQEAIRLRDALLKDLNETNDQNKARIKHLNQMVEALIKTIAAIEEDLRVARAA